MIKHKVDVALCLILGLIPSDLNKVMVVLIKPLEHALPFSVTCCPSIFFFPFVLIHFRFCSDLIKASLQNSELIAMTFLLAFTANL